MFISYLLPFVDRGAGAPHQWVFLAQLAHFEPTEIAFIADARYFDEATIPFGKRLSVAGLVFEVPSRERFALYRRHALQPQACGLEGRMQLDLFETLLTRPLDALEEQIAQATQQLSHGQTVQAFLTWSNCPSLSAAARRIQAPVIHNEIGPLRSPDYLNTVYFDLLGVNGGSTPSHWHSPDELIAQMQGACLLDEAQLRALLASAPPSSFQRSAERVGVALQVEDDSNIIAYAKGWNSLRLIYQAAADNPTDLPVLIRNHPHARFSYRGGLGEVDNSTRALDFLARLSILYSINSSLLTEAWLWEVPFQAMGDCPVTSFSQGSVLCDWAKAHRALALNAFFLGYLVPAQLLFSPTYYAWRLQKPRTLAECHAYHLQHIETSAIAVAGPQCGAASPAGPRAVLEPTATQASWLENQEVEKKLLALQVETATLRESLRQADGQARKHAQAAQALEQRLTQRETAVDWLESQQRSLGEELDARARALEELRAHLNSREEAVRWLEQQLASAQQELQARTQADQSLRAHLNSREEAVRWLEQQLAATQQELQAQTQADQSLRAHLNSREEAVRWLEQQLATCRQEVKACEMAASHAETELAGLRDALGRQKDELASRDTQINDLQIRCQSQADQLYEMKQQFARFRAQTPVWLLEKIGMLEWRGPQGERQGNGSKQDAH